MRTYFIIVGSLILIFYCFGCRNSKEVVYEDSQFKKTIMVDSLLDHYVSKYRVFINYFDDTTLFPRCYEKGELITTSSSEWTSGFFPGILWNLYLYSQEGEFYNAAVKWTNSLLPECENTSTHDIGFIVNSSFGAGYEISYNEYYKDVMLKAARSLASRYNSGLGCIKSLDDFENFKYPVLIDNLVNLEILFKAWKWTEDDQYYKIAYSHALTTMENHLRKNFSVYQLVDYDPIKRTPVYRGTFQGYSENSTWSRGQAWGLYGYSMIFRETKDRIFLDQAERLANFIINDPYVKINYIPFWDMDTPQIPDELKDASAAAILASALIELSTFQETSNAEKYFRIGENIIKTLGSKDYRSGLNENSFFIVKHCVGNYPGKLEVDVPLIYADYYLLEALLRYNTAAKIRYDE